MKKISVLKVITVLLMVALIIGLAKSSFAASTIQVQSIENSGGNSSNNVVNNVQNEPVNNVPVNNTPAPTPAPVNNTVLPKTGAKSTTGLVVLIVLTSISAVYTYIKVKEYNI